MLNSGRERRRWGVAPGVELTREIRPAKGNPMDGTSESGGLRAARKGLQCALKSLPLVDPISRPVEPGAQSVTPLSRTSVDGKPVKHLNPR